MAEDLSLVSTQAMLDELEKRFESIVFLGHADHSKAEDSTTYHYAGNYLTMLGAISRIAYQIQVEMDEVRRDGTHE